MQVNIGCLLFSQGKFPEAMDAYEQAMAIHIKALGPMDAKAAMSMMGVAMVLQGMGQLDKALEKYGEAIQIQEKTLGVGDKRVADSKNKCALLIELVMAGRPCHRCSSNSAIQWQVDSVPIDDVCVRACRGGGGADPRTSAGLCLCSMAIILRKQGKLAQALQVITHCQTTAARTHISFFAAI